MSETVDTRVVEAKFDSKQFEQGVDRTVKKLDELKKSLNITGKDKSIATIGEKIEETSDKASKSLEKLQDRFTSFTGMLKQKLLGGIADEIVGMFFKIENGIKNLITSLSSAQISAGMARYTDILTSVRTLVSAGVSQDLAYEAIERLGTFADQTSYSLDSLVSTMSKFKTAGASLDTARRMVEGLSNAAASMGVNAQQAERAYLNLQQAYSKGVMLQNDWMSFESLPMVGTKFNQAILDAAVKVGTLKKEANGTYTAVAKVIKATGGSGVGGGRSASSLGKGITAENMGSKLGSRFFTKKVMEEVFGTTYYFEAIERDELNHIKKVEKRLQESVKKGEMTQEQADAELQKELDKISEKRLADKTAELDEQLAQGIIDEKEYKAALEEFNKSNQLTVFGYNAFRAGQEARSLNDVLLTLKDTISRGWAKSFELIFGKLDEAAEFFTALTESNFANAIYAIGDIRNAILELWATDGLDGSPSGRDNILSALKQFDDLLGSIFEKMGLIKKEKTFFDENKYNKLLGYDIKAAESYKNEMAALQEEYDNTDPFTPFVESIGDRLMMLSRNFRIFAEQVNDFFTKDLVNGETRLQRIANVINGISEAINILTGAAAGLYYRVILPLASTTFTNLELAIQPLLDLFNPDKVNENGDNIFTKTSEGIENVLTIGEMFVQKVQPVIDILGSILGFFIDLSASTIYSTIEFFADSLGLASELLTGKSAQSEKGQSVIDSLIQSIKELGEVCKTLVKPIFDFFGALIQDFRNLLGLSKEEEKKPLFSNTIAWFNDNALFNTIAKWIKELPNKIFELIKKVPSLIGSFFDAIFMEDSDEVVSRYEDGKLQSSYKRVPNALKRWLDQAVIDVKDFILSIPSRIMQIPSLIGEFFRSIFYDKGPVVSRYENGKLQSGYTYIPNALKTWLDQAIIDVKAFITSIPSELAKVPSLIGEFFYSLFYKREVSQVTSHGIIYKDTKTPFKEWLDQAVLDVKAFILDIPNKVSKIPSLVGEFFRSIFYKREVSQVGINGVIYNDTKTPLKEWLDEAILNAKNFIKKIPMYLKKLPSLISEFFRGLFYKKKVVAKYSGGHLISEEVDVKTPLKEWLDTVINDIKEFAKNIPTYIGQGIGTIGNFIGTIISAIFGKSDGTTLTGNDIEGELQKPFLEVNVSNIIETIKNIGRNIINGIISVFSGNDDWDANKTWFSDKLAGWITSIRTKAEEVWPHVQQWFIDLPGKIASFFAEGFTSPNENEASPLGKAIGDFISGLGEWISSIPNTLLEIWKNVESGIGKLWTAIGNTIRSGNPNNGKPLFSKREYDKLIGMGGYTAAEEYRKATVNDNPIATNISDFFANLVDYIRQTIENFPQMLVDGWNFVMDLGSKIGPTILEGLNSIFTWVSDKITDVTTMLDEAHAEGKSIFDVISEKMMVDDPDNPGQKMEHPILKILKKIGATLKKLIVEVIPEFLKAAFEEIRTKLPELLSTVFGFFGIGGESEKETGKAITPYGQWIANQYMKKNSPFGGAESVGTSFLEALSQGIGANKSSMKNQDGIDFNDPKQVAAYMRDQASGNGNTAVATMLGFAANEKPLIDESKVNENTKALGTVGVLFEYIKDIFGNVTGVFQDSGAQMLMAIFGITLILNQLNDLISVRDTLEASAQNAKWHAIEIAVAGIVAIVGYLTYLASLDDKTKLDDVERLFDKIKDFVIEVGKLFAGIKALNTAGDFFDMISTLKGGVSGTTGNVASGLSGFFIGTAATTLAKPVSNALSNIAENIFGAIGDSFRDLAVAVDNFLEIIRPALEKFSGLKEVTQEAIAVLPLIDEFVNTFKTLFTKEEINGKTLTKPISTDTVNSVITEIEDNVHIFYAIGVSISSLATALKTFESIKDPTKEMERVNALIGSDGDLTSTFQEFMNNMNAAVWALYGQTMPNDTEQQGFTNALNIMGAMLNMLSVSIKDFKLENVEALNQLFEILAAFAGLEIKNNFEWSKIMDKDNDLAKFGKNLQKFGRNIEAFFNNVAAIRSVLGGEDAKIDMTEWKTVDRTIDFIIKISQGMLIAANAMGSYADAERMSAIGDVLPQFGNNLLTFMNNVQTFEPTIPFDFDYIYKVVHTISLLKKAVDGESSDYVNATTQFGYLADALVGSDGWGGFLGRIHDAAKSGEFDFTGCEVFMDSLYAIGEFIEQVGSIIGINDTFISTMPEKLNYVAIALVGEDGKGGFIKTLSDAWDPNNHKLDGIKTFIDILYELAQSLNVFYGENTIGEFKYMRGLENIQSLNWNNLLGEDFIAPKITPVLEISDDFKAKATQMRAMLGFDTANEQWDEASGQLLSSNLKFDPTSLVIPQPLDYSGDLGSIKTYLSTISSNTGNFNSSLSNLRIDMNGETVARIIAPYISMEQGREIMYQSRMNFLDGYNEGSSGNS